ncbi:unnamed protein product, partial [Iphiclides podalirius]
MYRLGVCLVLIAADSCGARLFCEKSKAPLEVGTWASGLRHLDSAVVENGAVSVREGQVYVYENSFPGHVIRYLHVDNVAIRSCGASAVVKKGGVGASSVLIVLHAAANEEIRSVVDIWGSRGQDAGAPSAPSEGPNNMKSIYLYGDFRAINHNKGFKVSV